MALAFADFYDTITSDGTSQLSAGDDLPFPSDGPASDTGIARDGDSTFTLEEAGVYLVQFNVPKSGYDRLVLALDDTELPYTLSGWQTGNAIITGSALVQAEAGSVLSLRVPADCTPSPDTGTVEDVTAHLIILRVQ